MEKLPFSPEGLQELLTSIYALPDAQLTQEAASVGADFRAWMKQNFLLAQSQIDFLDTIDNRFIALSARKIQYFMQNRLPITLNKTDRPSELDGSELKGRGKLIDLGNGQSAYYSEDGYEEEETLEFTITYPEAK